MEYINNPEAVISEIRLALAKSRAGEIRVETVRMAKQILDGTASANQQMKEAAQSLKDKLMGISSEGIALWNRA